MIRTSTYEETFDAPKLAHESPPVVNWSNSAFRCSVVFTQLVLGSSMLGIRVVGPLATLCAAFDVHARAAYGWGASGHVGGDS